MLSIRTKISGNLFKDGNYFQPIKIQDILESIKALIVIDKCYQ